MCDVLLLPQQWRFNPIVNIWNACMSVLRFGRSLLSSPSHHQWVARVCFFYYFVHSFGCRNTFTKSIPSKCDFVLDFTLCGDFFFNSSPKVAYQLFLTIKQRLKEGKIIHLLQEILVYFVEKFIVQNIIVNVYICECVRLCECVHFNEQKFIKYLCAL